MLGGGEQRIPKQSRECLGIHDLLIYTSCPGNLYYFTYYWQRRSLQYLLLNQKYSMAVFSHLKPIWEIIKRSKGYKLPATGHWDQSAQKSLGANEGSKGPTIRAILCSRA